MDGWTESRARVGHSELTWDTIWAQWDGCSVDSSVRHFHDTTEDEKQKRFWRPSLDPFAPGVYIIPSIVAPHDVLLDKFHHKDPTHSPELPS
jgi:hypothetical protein